MSFYLFIFSTKWKWILNPFVTSSLLMIHVSCNMFPISLIDSPLSSSVRIRSSLFCAMAASIDFTMGLIWATVRAWKTNIERKDYKIPKIHARIVNTYFYCATTWNFTFSCSAVSLSRLSVISFGTVESSPSGSLFWNIAKNKIQ